MKRMKTVCSVLLVGLSLPGLALENAYATPVETAMTQTQDRKVAFTGTVQDSKGEAIVGATILVKGQAKGKGDTDRPQGTLCPKRTQGRVRARHLLCGL